MRTTLTLDDDVSALLDRVKKQEKKKLKQIINEALRRGLLMLGQKSKKGGSYKMKPVSLGKCLVGNLDDVSEVLSVAEGDSFR